MLDSKEHTNPKIMMEQRNMRSLGSLPGDRQGMSGAGAGHGSGRTTGGRILRKRVPAIATTAQQQHHLAEQEASQHHTAPSNSLSAQYEGRTAQEGHRKTRIKWTREMNIDIIKAFYRANKCEDIPQPGYRQMLYTEFNKIRPELQLTEQNIIDRRNAIVKKGYLTTIETQNIRRQVGYENHQAEINENVETSHNEQMYQEENDAPLNQNTSIEDSEQRQIYNKFYSFLEFHQNIQPNKRPKIPRLIIRHKTDTYIAMINTILEDHLRDIEHLSDIHLALYCAAATIIEFNGQKTYYPSTTNKRNTTKGKPAWQWRLEKSIDQFRSKSDIIDEYLKGSRSKKIKRKIADISVQEKIDLNKNDSNQLLLEIKDTYRQKAKMKGARLRRYNELEKRKHQNGEYRKDRKRFFRNLESGNQRDDILTETPVSEFNDHWQAIWSKPQNFEKEAQWIYEMETTYANLTPMANVEFNAEDVKIIVKRTHNWKTPGPDNIHNFWLKYFPATYEPLARSFTAIINNTDSIPQYLTEATTYLLYKKGESSNPGNYRPITCLSVVYKLFTAMLYTKIYEHCDTNQIIAEEQKGCIKNALGCKHQLTIDAVVLKQAQIKQRNLNMAYIDYAKAFDSVPHDWLLKVLEIYKICPKIRNVLSNLMSTWKTRLLLGGQEIGTVNIRRGIFQGDSLSPLWFCLALNPLSKMLNSTSKGYKINVNANKKLNHILFMDDLKLYAETLQNLKSLVKTVEIFSNDIKMSFGLDKCAFLSIKKGVVDRHDEDLHGINELNGVYQYLGLPQHSRIDHSQLKRDINEKYTKRLTKICNTKLTGKNIIDAINSWAIPILVYSFGIIKWSETDLEKLDRKTRVILTKFRYLHTNSSNIRLYIPRKEGGRGLLNIKRMCAIQEQKIKRKLISSREELMKLIVAADEGYTPLRLCQNNTNIEVETLHDNIQDWREKELHGRYPKSLDTANIDKKASLQWIYQGHLYPETEGFVFAIQDRVIKTRNYQKHILKMDVVDTCRKCGRGGESIEHIMSGCPSLSNNAYLGRHNQLAKLIHQQLGIKYSMLGKDTPPYYKYTPKPVLETPNHIIYWDRPVITDKSVDHNRPDIIVIDRQKKTASIIDIAIPLTHNIQPTENEKVSKYEDLALQIKEIWKLDEVKTYPLVMSAEGVLTKNFKKNLIQLGLAESILKAAQKAILLQTCHIIRKFLN
jgi:hypothetical protein